MYGLITFSKTAPKDSVINEATLPDKIKERTAIKTPESTLRSLVFGNECGSPKIKKSVKKRAPPMIEDKISPEKNEAVAVLEKQ